MKIDAKRYIIVFFITVMIFTFTFWLSSLFGNKKIQQLRDIQERIALDILSTETRYNLLGQTACEHIRTSNEIEFGLSAELNNLARRLKFMESQLGDKNENVIFIKKYYTLLQIKDYMLVEELNARCGQEIFTILYFHGGECSDCRRQSLVLDQLVIDYPGTRVYWLDRDVDTPAMKTLVSLYNIKSAPTMVVGGKTYNGFLGLSEMAELLPDELKDFQLEDEALEMVKESDLSENENTEND
jgi:hypothetical protein